MASQKGKKHYTSGEFARLCGTTKETLRHNDEVGILKPAEVGENGYRYYTNGQFFDYDLIVTLKEAGCSLAEIKSYTEYYEPEVFLAGIKDKLRQLEAEKHKIESMQRLLQRAIETTEYALTEEYYKPRLVTCEEEYLITIKVAHPSEQSFSDMVHDIRDHYMHLEERDLWDEYGMGYIIMKETLEEGKDFASYYYTRIHDKREDERLQIRPAGQYVTMLHKGDYWTLPQSYDIIKKFIAENDLEICGNSYEYELVNHLAAQKMNDYIIQISVEVRPSSTKQ